MILFCKKHNYTYELLLGGPGCIFCASEVEIQEIKERTERLNKALADRSPKFDILGGMKMQRKQIVSIKNFYGNSELQVAIVTKVVAGDPELVNVTVFPDLGNPQPVSSVKVFNGSAEELETYLQGLDEFGRQQMFVIAD